MKGLKFIIFFLFILPIAKADGCGIVCPHGNDLLTFSLGTLCNFFTWGFCHIFAFIIVAITGILIFVFWKQQDDEKKKKVKMYLYGLLAIFILIILIPYIKTFAYTPVSVPLKESCYNGIDDNNNGLIDCKDTADCYASTLYSGDNGPFTRDDVWYDFSCAEFPATLTLTSDGSYTLCRSNSDPPTDGLNGCSGGLSSLTCDNPLSFPVETLVDGYNYYVLVRKTGSSASYSINLYCTRI